MKYENLEQVVRLLREWDQVTQAMWGTHNKKLRLPQNALVGQFFGPLADAIGKLQQYEAELSKVAEIVQRIHPVGNIKAIGLLECSNALTECSHHIEKLQADLQAAVEINTAIVNQECIGDEMHCQCVAPLRKENAELKERLALCEWLDNAGCRLEHGILTERIEVVDGVDEERTILGTGNTSENAIRDAIERSGE